MLTKQLAADLVNANLYHRYKMGYDVRAKKEDKIQKAFCQYKLLKQKLKHNIYSNIELLIKDTLAC